MSELSVGRYKTPYAQAEAWVGEYTAKRAGIVYGYPAYDLYGAEDRQAPLRDTDLLAPVLLNVAPSLTAYYWLTEQLDVLNEALAHIPHEAHLSDRSLSVELLKPLFQVLDKDDRRGVKLTTLSKILHRKRPGFVFVWDQFVRQCYVGKDASIQVDSKRSWGVFAVRIASVMRDDLDRSSDGWAHLAGLASGPSITPLRALDIVAWNRGKQGLSPGAQGEDEE